MSSPTSSSPLKIGVAGLGTVGGGLVDVLTANKATLTERLGRDIEIAAVSAINPPAATVSKIPDAKFFDDALAMARDPSIEVFVEVIGGAEGIARKSVEAALGSGKHVVTANKALLAHHGVALAKLAESKGVSLNFEAAVAGGIPVIKALREALAANRVKRVYGILNGTCNFILTKMQSEKRAFTDVLKEAQHLGYAEADPTFDIGGFDTAHKLTLLTSLAFGTEVALDQIQIEGIEQIEQADIEAADSLGYRIKLLGVATETPTGIEARVSPALVYKDSSIAEVSGVTNAVAIDGDHVGNILLVGAGAGAHPTASAVAGDIVDIARGVRIPPFVTPAAKLKAHKSANADQHYGSYYLRLTLRDEPGTMAAIAKRMADEGVSLESLVQHRPVAPPTPGQAPQPLSAAAPVIIITHETTERAVRSALQTIISDGKLAEAPRIFRIEEL
jgi:homoserine dehydrogenase